MLACDPQWFHVDITLLFYSRYLHAFSEVLLLFCSKELANFHRPKALWYPHDNEVAVKEQRKLPTKGLMKILVKSLGGKGIKLHVDAEETVSSVKAKASKKLGCHFSFGVVVCSVCSIFNCFCLLFLEICLIYLGCHLLCMKA